MSNDNTSSRKNGLVTVVLVLWLIGLTALFIMLMKSQKDNPIEARVAKLESRASKVTGKIPKPGDTGKNNDVAMLNQRISQLELKLGELNPGNITTASVNTAAPASGNTTAPASGNTTAPASGDPCNCNEFAGRLDKLEAMVMAKNTGAAKLTAVADVRPKAISKKSKPAKKSRKRIVRRSKRKSPVRSKAVRSASIKPEIIERSVSAKTNSTAYVGYEEKDYIGDSVYEITTRYGAMYGGYSNGELENLRRLNPGAAIYPGSSTNNYGTLTQY